MMSQLHPLEFESSDPTCTFSSCWILLFIFRHRFITIRKYHRHILYLYRWIGFYNSLEVMPDFVQFCFCAPFLWHICLNWNSSHGLTRNALKKNSFITISTDESGHLLHHALCAWALRGSIWGLLWPKIRPLWPWQGLVPLCHYAELHLVSVCSQGQKQYAVNCTTASSSWYAACKRDVIAYRFTPRL